MTMTIQLATKICLAHSIPIRPSQLGSIIGLDVLDIRYVVATGQDVSKWIPCPVTKQALGEWLGY